MKAMTQFCEQCGVALQAGSQFCEDCGHRVPSGMTDYSRMKELFDQAMAQEPSVRVAWLRQACGQQESLYSQLVQMLPKEQDSFLAQPAAIPSSLVPPPMPPPTPPPSSGPSSHFIGPYRVVKELGRGGMGIVFLAVRDDGAFRKNVALKLLLSDKVTPEFVQRFKQERQVLAAMDHPNIARILDGGDAPNGMPYYVMEFVDGIPVDKQCNEQHMGLTARIRVFQQLCLAVDYLHQNSIVHRDLKPTNILVTNDGTVKLLDFGIAKFVGAGSFSNADLTSVQGTPMTPNYASPEQVLGQTLQTHSDIYSLGVILYQLLTGRLPYDGWEDKQEKLAARHEPSPPSANIREDLKNKPESTAQLRRSMMGELDSIVLKAMRFDPKSRYSSPAELAKDLQRFLDGQEVTAHQAGLAKRSFRALHRRRAALFVLAGFLILGAFGAWQWRRVENQKAEIAAQESKLRSLLDELEKGTDPAKAPEQVIADIQKFKAAFVAELPKTMAANSNGSDQVLLKRGIQYLDRLTEAHPNRPPATVELALEIADAYEKLSVLQANVKSAKNAATTPSTASKAEPIQTLEKAAGVLKACVATAPGNQMLEERINRLKQRIEALGGTLAQRSEPAPSDQVPEAPPQSQVPAAQAATSQRQSSSEANAQSVARPAAAEPRQPPLQAAPQVVTETRQAAPTGGSEAVISIETRELLQNVESRILVAEQSIEPLRLNLEANGQMLNPALLSDMSSMKIRLNQARRAISSGNEQSAKDHLAAARAHSDRVLKAVGR